MARIPLVTTVVCIALASPFAVAACGGGSFTTGGEDGSAGGDSGGVVVVVDGGKDGRTGEDSGAPDARRDAEHDAGEPDARDATADRGDASEVDSADGSAVDSTTGEDAALDSGAGDAAVEAGCPGNETPCNGGCVDEQTDPNHCGGCDNVCAALDPPPANAASTCSGGVCGWQCGSGYQACPSASPTSCEIALADATNAVFVAPGGATSSCGTEAAPCGTLTAAHDMVLLLRGSTMTTPPYTLYVAAAAGTPYVEPGAVQLPPNVVVQGGWVDSSGDWSRPCDPVAEDVVIETTSADRVIWAQGVGSSALDTLALRNATTASGGTATGSGQTLYGIYAQPSSTLGTTLALTNVVIDVAGGGSGAQGWDGGAGGSAPAAGGCAPGTGQNGGTGGAGAGAASGTYDSAGYHAQSGLQAPQGPAGGNGTPPPDAGAGAPGCLTAYPLGSTSYTTDMSCCGGGAGCSSCSGSTVQLCGTTGANGCASGPSFGGYGGSGGGASVGVFAYGATVTLDGACRIFTGSGGAGGVGGLGGPVSAGSAGVAGTQSDAGASTSCSTGCGGTCCVRTGLAYGAAGAQGGNGGAGGIGGQGGGGSGGDSLCVVYGGGATVDAGASACQPGYGGPGGNAGQAGASGRSAATFAF